MNKRTRSIWLAILCLLTAAACGSDDAEEEKIVTYEVAAYKAPCYGMIAALCLQVRSPGQSSYVNLGDTVGGFASQWGRSYTIEVSEKTVANLPADGSSVTLQLRRIITETPQPSDTQFTVATDGNAQFVQVTTATGGSLLDTPFTCETEQACTDLAALATNNPALSLTFAYGATNGLPLVLKAAVLK
jgi:hypothetical protein